MEKVADPVARSRRSSGSSARRRSWSRCMWIVRRRAPGLVNRVFRRLQLVSGGFVAFTHGTNDAQKTMGIIALALVASGHLSADFDRPPLVGDRQRGARDGTRHLRRRLADHQDARDADRQARPAAEASPRRPRRPGSSSRPRTTASRSRRRTRSRAPCSAPARRGGSTPCAGASPATSSSRGCMTLPAAALVGAGDGGADAAAGRRRARLRARGRDRDRRLRRPLAGRRRRGRASPKAAA